MYIIDQFMGGEYFSLGQLLGGKANNVSGHLVVTHWSASFLGHTPYVSP